MVKRLNPRELRRRAARIKLVLTDCDGVLTDAGVYYSTEGEMLRRFSVRDGMGVARLRRAGIETGIVTGEQSANIRARAAKLQLAHIYTGVADKRSALAGICERANVDVSEIAFIGDDVNDLELMNEIRDLGLLGAPADAMAGVLASVHCRCRAVGGHGAFREFAEWLLAARPLPKQERT